MERLPLELYNVAQVRELERLIISEWAIPGIELMSRAGNAVFRHMQLKWPAAQSVSVFCGSGDNGGDGYIIAGLALAVGLKVTVYVLSDPEELKDNAYTAYRDYIKAKGVIVPFQANKVTRSDVIIDALFGIGLNKPVTDLHEQAIQTINNSQAHVIAVDVPSGLNAETGKVMGCAVRADYTVTFLGLKQGLFTGMAAHYCGEIIYSSLAVPKDVFGEVPAFYHRVAKKRIPPRSRCSHKGDHGHVLVIGGDKGYSGAVRMAAEAALRVGSGLVSVATHPEHSRVINIGRPELMCHGVTHSEQLLPLIAKANVIVLGPGLGQNKWSEKLFSIAIKSAKTLVIDADGLNLLAQTHGKSPHWVVTPHPGEAARLLDCSIAEIQDDRFSAASALQAKYGCIVVLKGAGTLIASADGTAVSTTGNPGMASGGMGDVLAGVIGGLLAQGIVHKIAAQQGVFLHGLAADLAAEKAGERGLLASDLLPYLRQLVN